MTEYVLESWLRCPSCKYDTVEIHRTIGDKGGTEALTLTCANCNEQQQIIP